MATTADRATTSRSPEVLVAEDDAALRRLLAVVLGDAGYTVRTVPDGRAALRELTTRPPDVLLLDLVMPDLDGWEVLEAHERSRAAADVPVVVLTSRRGERDVIRAHLHGAVAYVTKPFDVGDLVATVAAAAAPVTDEVRAVRRAQLRRFVSRLAELDAGRTASGPTIRFAGLEAPRRAAGPPPPPRFDVSRLSPRQEQIAAMLADGAAVRVVAERLGTTRSNVYATRSRIAHLLGVTPDAVADTARALGLTVVRVDVADPA